jgi:hypothetical protein
MKFIEISGEGVIDVGAKGRTADLKEKAKKSAEKSLRVL